MGVYMCTCVAAGSSSGSPLVVEARHELLAVLGVPKVDLRLRGLRKVWEPQWAAADVGRSSKLVGHRHG